MSDAPLPPTNPSQCSEYPMPTSRISFGFLLVFSLGLDWVGLLFFPLGIGIRTSGLLGDKDTEKSKETREGWSPIYCLVEEEQVGTKWG